MACQALGRCRICARKHKIAVFGSEEAQHFFIAKANLKLIILNTVCILCIGKIENFVKKMDLDMVFESFIKNEDTINYERDVKSEVQEVSSNDSENSSTEEELIKKENGTDAESKKLEEKSSGLSAAVSMDIDDDKAALKKLVKKSKDIIAMTYSASSTNSSDGCNSPTNEVANENQSDTALQQWRRLYSGDSQSAIIYPHYSKSPPPFGRENVMVRIGTSDKPSRKRSRNFQTIQLAEERNSKNNITGVPNSNSSSVIRSSASNLDSVDCSSGSIAAAADNKSSSFIAVKKGARSLSCDFCKKEFTHAGDLNKHRRKHTGEKPYECNECQRKFAHASNLARHQRVHSGERPFSCTKCDRTFTRRDKLVIHMNAGRCSSAAQIVINKSDDIIDSDKLIIITDIIEEKKRQT